MRARAHSFGMKNYDVRAAFAALSAIALLATGGCAAGGVNATPSLTAGSTAAVPAASAGLTYKVFTAGTTPGFPSSAFAADITPGPNGTMWFTDGGAAPAIGRISAAGTIKEFRNGLMPYAKPFRIALGADGNMWFSDAGNLAIGRITPNGKLSEFSAPNPNQIGARGLAISNGTPWFITCGGNAVLGSVSAQGKLSMETVPTDLSPDGTLAADARGDLWFLAVDQNSAGVVVERLPSGRLLKLPMHLDHGAEPCCPNEAPRRLTIGPDGHPWFTTQYFVSDSGANYIGTVRSGKVVLFKVKGYGTTGVAYPSGIASGKTLWFTGGNPFGLSGGLWNVGAKGRQIAYKLPYNPFGLTVDAAGNPWFTATFNSTPSQIVEAVVK